MAEIGAETPPPTAAMVEQECQVSPLFSAGKPSTNQGPSSAIRGPLAEMYQRGPLMHATAHKTKIYVEAPKCYSASLPYVTATSPGHTLRRTAKKSRREIWNTCPRHFFLFRRLRPRSPYDLLVHAFDDRRIDELPSLFSFTLGRRQHATNGGGGDVDAR